MRLTQITCSYFKKYIEREIKKSTGVEFWKPIQGWRRVGRKRWHYNEHRPWTDAAKDTNTIFRQHNKEYLEPVKEWKIFKGDRVEILTGKDRGKQGIINSVVMERNWCFVEGLNCKYSAINKTSTSPGQMNKEEKPLLVTSEVSLVDPSDNKPTPVEWRYTEEGDKVRVSARTGRVIPISKTAEGEAEDYVNAKTYQVQEKDTREDELKKVTFKPKLTTFEQDIFEKMGIKDDRPRAKTYWY